MLRNDLPIFPQASALIPLFCKICSNNDTVVDFPLGPVTPIIGRGFFLNNKVIPNLR